MPLGPPPAPPAGAPAPPLARNPRSGHFQRQANALRARPRPPPPSPPPPRVPSFCRPPKYEQVQLFVRLPSAVNAVPRSSRSRKAACQAWRAATGQSRVGSHRGGGGGEAGGFINKGHMTGGGAKPGRHREPQNCVSQFAAKERTARRAHTGEGEGGSSLGEALTAPGGGGGVGATVRVSWLACRCCSMAQPWQAAHAADKGASRLAAALQEAVGVVELLQRREVRKQERKGLTRGDRRQCAAAGKEGEQGQASGLPMRPPQQPHNRPWQAAPISCNAPWPGSLLGMRADSNRRQSSPVCGAQQPATTLPCLQVPPEKPNSVPHPHLDHAPDALLEDGG